MTEPPAPAPPYQPDGPPAPPSKPRRSVSLLVAGLIALGVGLVSCLAGIGAGGATTATKASVSYAPSPYPVVSTVERTVTVTVAPPSPPPPPGPATSLSEDGTYLVGSDIAPGMYRANSITSSNCYWARLKSTDTQDILGNDNVSPGGQAIVTIKASDKAFETQGCGAWQKIG